MLLPAAVRYLDELDAAGDGAGLGTLVDEIAALVDEFVAAIRALEAANAGHPPTADALEAARYVQRRRSSRR